MKGFFTMVGFVGVLIMSGAISFIGIGYMRNTDKAMRSSNRVVTTTEEDRITDRDMNDNNEVLEARIPERITKKKLVEPEVVAKKEPVSRPLTSSRAERVSSKKEAVVVDSRERLRDLYSDKKFVQSCIDRWKSEVENISAEYNLKPEVIMALVMVKSYLGDYSRSALHSDAQDHAGERPMTVASALDNYEFGWSMNKLIDKYNLDRKFGSSKRASTSTTTEKRIPIERKEKVAVKKTSERKKETATSTSVSSVEKEFQRKVAQSMGFRSWKGLINLANHEDREKAQQRVKAMMLTSRIK